MLTAADAFPAPPLPCVIDKCTRYAVKCQIPGPKASCVIRNHVFLGLINSISLFGSSGSMKLSITLLSSLKSTGFVT